MKIDIAHKRILFGQAVAFAVFIIMLWLMELVDFPSMLFHTPLTPVNVPESIVETVLCALVGTISMLVTIRLQRRVRHLEEFIVVCSRCKRVHVNDQWVSFELFLQSHTDSTLSHGLCEDCLQLLYPDIASRVLEENDK